jgi:glutamate racemase
VTQQAAPLLAPIVEEGWEASEIARLAVERYVEPLRDVDTVVLGCTHYPLLLPALEAALPGKRIVDPAPFVADRLGNWLLRHPTFDSSGSGALRVLCSGEPEAFRRHGGRFLGSTLPPVEAIAEVEGRLALRATTLVEGQVVRG